MKVLLVSPLPPPAGGIANWSAAVLQEAHSRSDVEVVHLDTAVRWRSTNNPKILSRLLGGAWQALNDTFRVYRAIRVHRPTVLHLCTSASLSAPKDILILGLARMLGVRSVVHYRFGRLPDIIPANTWEWKLIRQGMLLADTVLLLDRTSEESVKAVLHGIRVQRIPNPIDAEMYQAVASLGERKSQAHAPAQIVFAGWVVPTKGVRELVEACLAIGDVSFELNLVGNVLTDFRSELERIAAQRNDGKWLRFHGMLGRTEAFAAIGNADLFVLPSYTEGFPNVVSEAMVLGRPIIATRVGAIPDMLGDGTGEECGILIAPQSVNELREAIRQMLTNPEEAIVYGERARRKALSLYAMKNVMEQYVALWRSLQEA